jgi:hypothetical protein
LQRIYRLVGLYKNARLARADQFLNKSFHFRFLKWHVAIGELVGDNLSGTFATEGMTGTWTAERKK